MTEVIRDLTPMEKPLSEMTEGEIKARKEAAEKEKAEMRKFREQMKQVREEQRIERKKEKEREKKEMMEEIKNRFYVAMLRNFGNVTKSLNECNLVRSEYYEMLKDKAFKKRLKDAEFEEQKKDFIEDSLMKLVKDRDRYAVQFAAKTKLKDRGYVERREVTGKDGGKVSEIKVTVVNPNSRDRKDNMKVLPLKKKNA